MANLSRLLLDSAPYITLVINGPGEIVITRPKPGRNTVLVYLPPAPGKRVEVLNPARFRTKDRHRHGISRKMKVVT